MWDKLVFKFDRDKHFVGRLPAQLSRHLRHAQEE